MTILSTPIKRYPYSKSRIVQEPVKEMPTRRLLVGVDIETLSLRQDCVIYEIGVAHYQLPIHGATVLSEAFTEQERIDLIFLEFDCISTSTIYLNILEQQFQFGRHVDESTVSYHLELMEKAGVKTLEEYFGQGKAEPGSAPCRTAAEGLDRLRVVCENAEQVWINHPEFDIGRLTSLALDVEFEGDLWPHRSVRDVATRRDSPVKPDVDALINAYNLRSPPPPGKGKHTGAYDAKWNLQVAIAERVFLQSSLRSWNPETNLLW